MKKNLIISLILLALIITACGGQTTQTSPKPAASTEAVIQPAQPGSAAPAANVSFTKNVMPILENSCTSCHGVDQTKAGLDMRTYESLMAGSSNGSVIVAGKSVDSLLVQLVTKGRMPKRGSKLTPEQIQTISDWIDAGALNN